MKFRHLFGAALPLLTTIAGAQGTWSTFNAPAGFNPVTMIQLTDGSIMMGEDFDSGQWYKLSPAANGNYSTGTWTALTTCPVWRLYYGIGVLADGRVICSGGEYVSNAAVWSNRTHVYDPVTNSWTEITAPAGWGNIGDPPHAILPDGRYYTSNAVNNKTAFFNPATNVFTPGPNKTDSGSEEGFVLMQEGTLVNPMGVNSPGSEKYNPATNTWFNSGNLPVSVYEASSREPGSGLSLYDGRMFYPGGTGHTVIYTQGPLPSSAGTWIQGPDFPIIATKQVGTKDSMSTMLTNGKMMILAGPVDGVAGNFLAPTYFFEFNPTTNTMAQVTSAPSSADPPYVGRVLTMPNGQMLFSHGANQLQVYTSTNPTPNNAWRPTVAWAPAVAAANNQINVFGTQINGLSQGASYGDEGVPNTNFPLVRLVNTSTNNVYYCRTHDHSTMGIAPGAAIEYTRANLPAGIPAGNYNLFVVANGIPNLTGRPIQVVASTTIINCHVVLQNWIMSPKGMVVTVTVNGTPYSAMLDSNSDFSLPVPSTGASATIKIKGSHWLQKTQSATLTAGGTLSLNASLVNGDAASDNVIDLGDFDTFALAYGSSAGDVNYNSNADFDGDGTIDLGDFDILARNFGLEGDA